MPQLPITPAVTLLPGAGISQAPASAAEGGDGLDAAPGLDFGAVLAKQLKGVASLLVQKEDAGFSLAAANEGAGPAAIAGAAMLLPVDLSVLTASMLVPASPAPAGIFVPASPAQTGMLVPASPAQTGMLVPSSSVRTGVGAGTLAEAGAEKPLMQFPDAGEARSAESVANAGVAVLPVDLSIMTASMLAQAHSTRDGAGGGISAEASTENPLMLSPKAGEARLAAEIAAGGKNSPLAMSPEQQFADRLAALVETPADNAGGEFNSTDLSAAANPSATAAVFKNPEPLPALPVSPRVGSAEWGGAVGEKVVWMANQSHQVAELHLNPPNLGPLEVRLTISNDQASALFVSHHSAVRDAIETALPRLREMLADNGIMLGNVTVGSESFSQQQASDQRDGKEGSRSGPGAEGVMARMVVPGRPAGPARDGMVDIFA